MNITHELQPDGSVVLTLDPFALEELSIALDDIPEGLTDHAADRLDDDGRHVLDELRRQVQGANRLARYRRLS